MDRLRVAVLVDLPREAAAGGHVKYWERMAAAAVKSDAPLDLTLYFSGFGTEEVLSPHVRYRYLPPVFSTANLKFLPYIPAHTDLANFHPKLAEALAGFDVIHTTDAYFAFARTAERVARWHNIPLVTSFHTDTPAYAEIYTRQTLQHFLGKKFGGWIADTFNFPSQERIRKEKSLGKHLKNCTAVLAMRAEDVALAQNVVARDKIKLMRLGVDKDLFTPQKSDRAGVERDYKIAADKFMVLFVGRIDAGKNMPVLMRACMQAIEQGINIHLIVAGLGPMDEEVKKNLGDNVTLAGWVEPPALARLYASVDCLAVASDIEIGGMIGLEALACGCPVLVSKQSGMAQACGAVGAMHMVESDVEQWAQALQSLAVDKTRQAVMRATALDFRRDNLAGWDDVLLRDFLPVWQSVARKG